jgi:hypothetical protein
VSQAWRTVSADGDIADGSKVERALRARWFGAAVKNERDANADLWRTTRSECAFHPEALA